MTVIYPPVCFPIIETYNRTGRRLRWLCLTCFCIALPSAAIDGATLLLGTITGPGWRAEDVALRLNGFSANRAHIQFSARRVVLPAAFGELADVNLDCADALVSDALIRCEQGRLSMRTALLDNAEFTAAFAYRPADKVLDVHLTDIPFAQGRLTLALTTQATAWRATLSAQSVDSARLPALLRKTTMWPPGYKVQGQVSGSAQLHGNAEGVMGMEARATMTEFGFSSADGVHAGEELSLDVEAKVTRHADHWKLAGELQAQNGTLCIDTCWTLPATPVRVTTAAQWSTRTRRLEVERLHLTQAGLIDAEARFTIDLAKTAELQALNFVLKPSSLADLYATYLQPLAIGSAFERLKTAGRIGASIDYRAQGYSRAQVTLDAVTINDGNERFGVEGISGDIHWTNGEKPVASALRWENGHIYRLTLGSGALSVSAHDSNLRLLQATRLPILDGALEVRQFEVENAATDAMRLRFEGSLLPVSMEALSRALEWPLMSGKLSGVIPEITFADGVLAVGGVLLIRAFDGAVTFRNVRLERVFDVAPVLRADIDIDAIDLLALTRTFSFGSIQGRLGGFIHDLRLIDWLPVAFDAYLRTPLDDKSRHRISQRAVENLSSLGGGVSGVLSRGFLRLFDDFSYAKLGIRCRLHNGVCEMGGVAPAPNGYYLVQGGGLPRINVIGFAERVDWDTLVKRLQVITAGNAPVIK